MSMENNASEIKQHKFFEMKIKRIQGVYFPQKNIKIKIKKHIILIPFESRLTLHMC